MASKNKHCDFCGKKMKLADMIPHNGKYLCDKFCLQLFSEAYEGQEVKKEHE